MIVVDLPVLQVVSGVIQNTAGLYLVALRPPHVPFPGLWEFPGGKIEAGETTLAALQRELREEIGIRVTKAAPLLHFQYAYPTRIIDMSAWSVLDYQGEPYGAENQDIAWVDTQQLITLPFPEGNQRLIQHLLLEK